MSQAPQNHQKNPQNPLLQKILGKKAAPASPNPGDAGAKPGPQDHHDHSGLKNGEACPDCGVIHKCHHGPKQSTRLLKAGCGDCDWFFRISFKAAKRGLPKCPICSKQTGFLAVKHKSGRN